MGVDHPPPSIDRASGSDLMTLAVDRGSVPMNIGALLELSPEGAPTATALREVLADRVPRVRRLRQRLVRTPPGCGRAVWADDPGFALDRHVGTAPVRDLVAGSQPGRSADDPRLRTATDLVLTRLPRDRPLWRARILEDGSGRAVGLAIVLHHVVADGMGGLAVLATLVDEAVGLAPSQPPCPAPDPSALAADAWRERLAAVGRVPAAVRRLGSAVTELGLRGPRGADRCSLLRATSGDRRVHLAEVDLEALHSGARRRGVRINDLVVVAVSGALVDLLAGRGERVSELVVSVPVSARAQSEAGSLGNATGVIPIRVPAVQDRDIRLAAVAEQSRRLQEGARGASAALLTPVFRGLAAVGAFQALVARQHLVHTFETNVRGPQTRVHLAGGEVARIVPVAVNPGNVTVSFDVLSYAGRLAVAVVVDPEHVHDGPRLAALVEDGLAALAAGADGRGGAEGPR